MATKKATKATSTSPATREPELIIKKCKAPYDTWSSRDGQYAGECFFVSRENLENILASNSNEMIFVRTIEKV